MAFRLLPRAAAVAALLAAGLLFAAPSGKLAPKSAAPAAGAAWVRVDYGALVDERRLTHSGEPVSVVLDRLGGRAAPPAGEPAADALAYRLLDPLLEPYAFTLSDALDSLAPPHDPPLVEVGGLFEPGGAEPAWVELCRARRFVLESDGEGFLRALLPAGALEALPYDDALPEADAVATAEAAWREAWPVLRHALAAERRRLARLRGGALPALDVEVHAYRHLLSRQAFVLGARGFRTRVESTDPDGSHPPVDLAALRSILDRGLTIEGGRLAADGTIRWFTAESDPKPQILGRPPTLADLAVAYRAVAHGGAGEPYMSLDRASAPQIAEVNYGGRLRDTSLGLVSLLCDVRFKTFSVGVDLLGGTDARAAARAALPEFRTHLERFAADPGAGAVLNQQTRFWFYPDDVDLTVSAQGDVLAFRRASMAAAAERADEAATQAEPPWTRDTVGFLNEKHAALARAFPEIASLDETVRYLALFTWLTAARDRGLAVPDLDALLAVEIPPTPTPRRFPQLLSYDVLPPPGKTDAVDVYDRTAVGEALDRLDPRDGKPLTPVRRLRRALARLDRRVDDQAALATEIEAQKDLTDPARLDLYAYRAERLLMHARVLATLPAGDRSKVDARRGAAAETRVFSVGIGGVDLGMHAVFARAETGGARLALGLGATHPAAAGGGSGAPLAGGKTVADPAWKRDPEGLPATELPDHGLGPASGRASASVEEGKGKISSRVRDGSLVRTGTWTPPGAAPITWEETRAGVEGPEVRARRRVGAPGGAAPTFERVEDGRFLSYTFERTGERLRAAPSVRSLPDRVFGDPPPPGAAPLPEGLTVLGVSNPPGPTVDMQPPDRAEPAMLALRIRSGDGRDASAEVPRGLLQRLVLGREVDLAPERPLQAFTPARQVVAGGSTLMVQAGENEVRAPWSGPKPPQPGEEDAARLARALSLWWGADPGSAGVAAVVGTSPESPRRWSAAPKLGGPVTILAPSDAFPSGAAPLRARAGAAVASLPASGTVLLVSAEPPGLLGRRLRTIARDPTMNGRLLAVVSLGGAMRGDLPASLLAEGHLAAIGVDDGGPLGLEREVEAGASWARAAGAKEAAGKRAESIPGPFTWFY